MSQSVVWDRHIGNQQPINTYGMQVAYRCHGSTIVHHPVLADSLNWVTRGAGSASIGRISEFVVLGNNFSKRGK